MLKKRRRKRKREKTNKQKQTIIDVPFDKDTTRRHTETQNELINEEENL